MCICVCVLFTPPPLLPTPRNSDDATHDGKVRKSQIREARQAEKTEQLSSQSSQLAAAVANGGQSNSLSNVSSRVVTSFLLIIFTSKKRGVDQTSTDLYIVLL